MSRTVFAMLLSLLLMELSQLPCLGQDFRVESDIYVNGDKEPLIEQLTLFQGELAYDFNLKGPGQKEITILDLEHGKIVLLDAQRRKKTDIRTAGLLDFCAQIKTIGTREEEDGLFAPKFSTKLHPEQKVVELVSRRLTYRVSGIEPREAKAAERYHNFADWYARLNALRPGSLPPFGRLEVNRVLAEQGWLPERIERTIVLDAGFNKQTVRSEHVVDWLLSNTDRRRIQDAAGYLGSFQEVGLQDYLQVEAVATK